MKTILVETLNNVAHHQAYRIERLQICCGVWYIDQCLHNDCCTPTLCEGREIPDTCAVMEPENNEQAVRDGPILIFVIDIMYNSLTFNNYDMCIYVPRSEGWADQKGGANR